MRKYHSINLINLFIIFCLITFDGKSQGQIPPKVIEWSGMPKYDIVKDQIEIRWKLNIPAGYEIVPNTKIVVNVSTQQGTYQRTFDPLTGMNLGNFTPEYQGRNRIRIQCQIRMIGPPPGVPRVEETPPEDVLVPPKS